MFDAPKILVRGPNWVGDVVMATPGFRALRAAYASSHITLQLRPGLESLVEGAPWFDEVLPLDSYRRGVWALLREGRRLHARRFDLGLCLPDSWSSALLMRSAGVRRIVGYRSRGREALLDVAVELPAEGGRRRLVARERHVLGLTGAIGCPPRGSHLELFVSERQEAAARALLAERGVGENELLAALAPGAFYGAAKQWPPDFFARVGDALAAEGMRVVLVGAPSEAALARRIQAAMRAPVLDLTPALNLGLLKASIRRARLLVCCDAGARHVAVAFGVPCVVLLGPTSLAKTDCNLERIRALAADVGCRPCYHRVCPTDHRCMTRLDPARVIEAARAALAESPARSGRALREVSAAGSLGGIPG